MNTETQTMMREAAQLATSNEENSPWEANWTGLTFEEALRGSQIIEDVIVSDGVLRVFMEENPTYITKEVNIIETGHYFMHSDANQKFPFGFDMSGQIIEQVPPKRVADSDDAVMRVVAVLEDEHGRRNTTTFQVPLDVDSGSLVVSRNCSRAGYEECL